MYAAYLSAEANYINGKIEDISHLHISSKHHSAWKTVKEVAGKNNNPNIRIKGGSPKVRLSNWLDHFKTLLGREPKVPENCSLPSVRVSETLGIDTNKFTIPELQVVVKQLKSSKEFGPDNIPAIIWKGRLVTCHKLQRNFPTSYSC